MMMKKQVLNALLAVWVASLSGVALHPSSSSAQAVVTTEGVNGSVELGNVSDAEPQQPVATEAAADVASATPTTAPSPVEPPKDPREQYRDKVMKMPEGQPMSATSAVSRRYKKMDKAAYQASMQDSAAQTAPAPQAGGKTAN
jgi:type IV secretory pathway VirB10-like protein